MNRLANHLKLEFIMQWRNGFIAAVAFVALLWVLLLRLLPSEALIPWLPLVIMGNLMITSFYFLAGQILLDKAAGTLEALAVTPLSSGEFITLRVFALAALATVENLIVVWLGIGFSAISPLAIVPMFIMAALYGVFGYLAVIRFDNISNFLMPSMLVTMMFLLAWIPWLGWLPSFINWLHPFGPILTNLTSWSVGEINWQSLIALALSLVLLIVLLKFAVTKHQQFVLAKAGDGA